MSCKSYVQSALNQGEALSAGLLIKQDHYDFTEVSLCYKIDFDKRELALSGKPFWNRVRPAYRELTVAFSLELLWHLRFASAGS